MNEIYTQKKEIQLKLIKKLIWLYIILVFFEGALRKWFLPSLASPLLVVRDPIALYILFRASALGFFKPPLVVKLVWIICIFSICVTLVIGHQNLIVALFGSRILLIHFSLAFLIGQVFNKEDVVQIGKFLTWTAVPMTILVSLQFFSPPDALVNVGVNGEGSVAGFTGALGYNRPPGTFSFTNGNSLFYALMAPFIFYFWLTPNEKISRILLISATVALILAVPLSISRALFFNVCLVGLFAIIASAKNPAAIKNLLTAAICLSLVLFILTYFNLMGESTAAFSDRLENANEAEGGLEGVLVDRFLGGMYKAVFDSQELPFFGYGLGMGTNVGAVMLTGGAVFLISEGEWGRIIGEIGPILGLVIIIIRLYTVMSVFVKSYKLTAKMEILPWLLLSTGLVNIAQGGWGQPTALGFFVIYLGLVLACTKPSLNNPN